MRVVSLMRLGDQEQRLQETFPNVDFEFYKHPSYLPESSLKEMDILMTYHKEVDASFIDKAKNLKWLMWFATGVNTLPFDALRKRNIQVTNAKGVHAQQLTEFLFAYILDDYKEMKETYEEQLSKIYNHKRTTASIAGETILFLGTGVIPKRAAQIAQVFGMKTLGLNTNGHAVEGFDETYPLSERTGIYAKANIVVNVLPETEETTFLLQKSDFDKMNTRTLFINIGRGTVVKENVLVQALKEKNIRKAYLDVYENEPLTDESGLYELDNVVMTSHITGNAKYNKTKATDIFINNLQSVLNNEGLIENVVDLNKGY